jgi:hypothetical protein
MQGRLLLTMSLDAVGSTAVRVLKDLVQLSATRHLLEPNTVGVAMDSIVAAQTPTEIVASLAQQLDSVRHPRAKACVFWLVGQYAMTNQEEIEKIGSLQNGQIPGMAIWAPDVLRRAVKSFTKDVSVRSCGVAEILIVTRIAQASQATNTDPRLQTASTCSGASYNC